jgi:quinoprotein glucose dehydrogenase
MMKHPSRRPTRWPYALVAAFAAAGSILAALAYFGTASGVDGTTGALLGLLGALAVTIAALVCLAELPRGVTITLDVLLLLGAVLTAFAAWMLMQYLFAAAMVLSLLALVAAISMPRRKVPV